MILNKSHKSISYLNRLQSLMSLSLIMTKGGKSLKTREMYIASVTKLLRKRIRKRNFTLTLTKFNFSSRSIMSRFMPLATSSSLKRRGRFRTSLMRCRSQALLRIMGSGKLRHHSSHRITSNSPFLRSHLSTRRVLETPGRAHSRIIRSLKSLLRNQYH